MSYSVDAALGESIDESAMAELGYPVEQSERSGWAAAVPSPEKYTYFFVPSMSGDTSDALASDEFGALLRLGSYSDIEEAARDIRPQVDHYPRHHLRDEGGPDAALTQASGGQQGIMLACDGRFLIRSNEKMYVDTGDYDQYTSGDYDLEVAGTMRLATTGSPGGITISSAQDTLTLESGPDQDITISAGDGSGNIIRRAKTSSHIISGKEYALTIGFRFYFTLGSSIDLYAGANITTTGALNAYTCVGADLYVRSLYWVVSLVHVECRLVYQDITKIAFRADATVVEKKVVECENSFIKIDESLMSQKSGQITTEQTNIKSKKSGTVFANSNVKTSSGGTHASMTDTTTYQ